LLTSVDCSLRLSFFAIVCEESIVLSSTITRKSFSVPESLQKKILDHNADAGFAFDGDGDRVLAVNKNGTIKDGDDILTMLLQHPEFVDTNVLVGTIMTNYGLEQHLLQQNKKLVRTKVGDKYVSAYLVQHNLLLGGEASGHIIMRNHLNTGDGIFVALKTLESIIANNNWDMKTFKKTPQCMINVPVLHKQPLDQEPYKTIIQKSKKLLLAGRIIVRYSGTEKLLRVMVEDKTIDSSQTIAKKLSLKLQSTLVSKKTIFKTLKENVL